MVPESFSCRLEYSTCPLGCPEGDESLLTGHDRIHHLPGEFNLVRCRACGLVRTNPRPTSVTMSNYYPDDYGPYLGTRVLTKNRRRQSWWKTLGKKIFEFNTHRLPPLPAGKMLEIGCASGAFLQKQQENGWTVAGIEFSPSAARHARQAGFNVHCGTVEAAPTPEDRFDLVVGWMVLEHLHDPLGALRRLHGWSRPGATLVVSVPHVTELHYRLFGPCWYGLQLPTHLYQFTPKTLDKLLVQGHWRIEKIFHHRLLNCLVGSLGHRLSASGHTGLLARWLEAFPDRATRLHYLFYPLAAILAALGQTGRMTVWARRIDD